MINLNSAEKENKTKRKKRSSVQKDNKTSLELYLKEASLIPVLNPKEEFRMATRVERLEVILWHQLLKYPPVIETVVGLVEEHLKQETAAITELVRCSSQLAKHPHDDQIRHRYDQCCKLLAPQIHAEDPDRELTDRVLSLLSALVIKQKGGDLQSRDNNRSPDGTTLEEHWKRVILVNRAALNARQQFVGANLRLVITIARKYNNGILEFNDLLQEGNLGLIKAVGRFDPSRGFRFSTYAAWWIRHMITRAITKKGQVVRMPSSRATASKKANGQPAAANDGVQRRRYSAAYSAFSSIQGGRIRIEGQSGFKSGLSHFKNSGLPEGDAGELIEQVPDPRSHLGIQNVQDRELYAQVEQVFEDLSAFELDVLRRRFGLAGVNEQTLKEIGHQYSLSRERIRQIQERALERIRSGLKQRRVM